MSSTTLNMSPELHKYLIDHSLRDTPTAKALRIETQKLTMGRMQISPEQGQLMAFLVALTGSRKAIEVGTFTGYSALCVALALPQDGYLLACDVSEEWTSIGRKYWSRAGVAQKIDLQLAPALDTLNARLPAEQETFDFAFIDADKFNYDGYYELCLKLLKPGGLILVDNVLWGGSVIEPSEQDTDTVAIRKLNAKIHQDERVDVSMLPVGDGLTLVRKR